MKQLATMAMALIVTASAASQTTASTAGSAGMGAEQGRDSAAVIVQAVLNKSIDAKKAKPGDKIEAKLSQGLKSSAGAELPKGTKLVGHVTEAKAHTKTDQGSTLGIVFDEAIPKNGESIPFHASVVAVAPPPPAPTVATTNLDAAPTGAGGGGSGSARAGANPTYSNDVGVLGNGGRATRDVQLTAASRGAIGLPGVTLQSENSGQATGSVLTSKDENVKLESGSRLSLLVQPSTGKI